MRFVLKQIKSSSSKEMRKTVENQENLTLRQTMIDEILVEDGKVIGVRTATHQEYGAKAVIVTTGTALRGEIIIGDLKYSSGPNHSLASINLAENLKKSWTRNWTVQNGYATTCKGIVKSIMKKRKFNLVMKIQITFLTIRVTRII